VEQRPAKARCVIDARQLRLKLKSLGLTDEVVDLAWPSWWSDDAETSASARAELRFVLARRLGLDARALLDNDEPRFVWKVATFKNLTASSATEREAITSFATSVARTLVSAAPRAIAVPASPLDLRRRLLAGTQVIGLQDLLALCWAIGVPVIHLKTLPLRAKRMCAMAVSAAGRPAILLAKDSKFPSQVAFWIAHELGHIALRHLEGSPAIIDVKDPLRAGRRGDPQEEAADTYALELLTGEPAPEILTGTRRYSAEGLAAAVLRAGAELRIDSGVLALCFGHSTGEWGKVTAALKLLFPGAVPVGPVINRVAFAQISDGSLSQESEEYLRAATGAA
jgi:hypothetical protein